MSDSNGSNNKKPSKFKHESELTEQVLVELCPDQVALANAVMQVFPTLFSQTESGVKEMKNAVGLYFIQDTPKNLQNILRAFNTSKKDQKRLIKLYELIHRAVNMFMAEAHARETEARKILMGAGQSCPLEVLDEHREEFYQAYVDFLKPFAEKDNKEAQQAIDPKERKSVLKNGPQSLARMAKIAGTADAIPEWILDLYGLGVDWSKLGKELEAKKGEEKEEKKE